MKKIPKKEYKLEYTSLLGDRTYADVKVLEELPFDQAAYLAA